MIVIDPIETFDEADQTADTQKILQAFLEGPGFNLNSKAGKREEGVEKIEHITVNGDAAAVADLNGIEASTEFTAHFVFVDTGDRGAIILGVGQSEAWETFDPTFEAMLASMTFRG